MDILVTPFSKEGTGEIILKQPFKGFAERRAFKVAAGADEAE